MLASATIDAFVCFFVYILIAYDPFTTQIGIVTSGDKEGQVVIRVSERYFRPAEVDLLLGEPSKAKNTLGWDPMQTPLEELVNEMVDADVEMASDPQAYLKY